MPGDKEADAAVAELGATRLAWGMTKSEDLRAECVSVGREAAALIHRVAAQR